MDIYISSAIKNDLKETIKIANELKVNIEINKFYYPEILEENPEKTLNEYAAMLKDFDGKISMHGPYKDLNPVSTDPKIRDASIYRYNQILNAAKKLNAGVIVFHTKYDGFGMNPFYIENFIENEIIFWSEFIKRFEDSGITVVLENTYEQIPDIICAVLEGVNSKYLKACIDTGHVNLISSLNIAAWIEKIGKNLHHMHVHNNYGIYDEHNSILEGNLDFGEIIKTLKENNLNPNLVVEIFKPKPALESMEFIKACLG